MKVYVAVNAVGKFLGVFSSIQLVKDSFGITHGAMIHLKDSDRDISESVGVAFDICVNATKVGSLIPWEVSTMPDHF